MGNVIIYDSLNYRSDVDHLLTRYQILENRLIDIGIGLYWNENCESHNIRIFKKMLSEIKDKELYTTEIEEAKRKIDEIKKYPLLSDNFTQRKQISDFEKYISDLKDRAEKEKQEEYDKLSAAIEKMTIEFETDRKRKIAISKQKIEYLINELQKIKYH